MKMTGEEIIAAPRRVVWDALNDPEVLKQCITGCEEIKKKSDTEFEAKVTAKVGPVKASFIGAVKLSKLNPPRSYVISGEGKGGVAGFAKGGATVQLSDTADGQTKLSYDVDAQVGGKLAQIGSRLIDSTAKKMAADFFKKFNKVVSERAQAAAAAAPAKAEAKKAPAKKAATKKAAATKTAAAAPAKKAAETVAEKPAKKAAKKPASKAAASKASAAAKSAPVASKPSKAAAKKTAAKKTAAAKKPAKSAASSAGKPAEAAAAKAPAAAGTAASATQQAASSAASTTSQPASKANDAMPPQAQAMSKLWIWAVIAAVAGLIVVWATGSGGGQ
jgi:carbon monoxide dehydrogenase subunit G